MGENSTSSEARKKETQNLVKVRASGWLPADVRANADTVLKRFEDMMFKDTKEINRGRAGSWLYRILASTDLYTSGPVKAYNAREEHKLWAYISLKFASSPILPFHLWSVEDIENILENMKAVLKAKKKVA